MGPACRGKAEGQRVALPGCQRPSFGEHHAHCGCLETSTWKVVMLCWPLRPAPCSDCSHLASGLHGQAILLGWGKAVLSGLHLPTSLPSGCALGPGSMGKPPLSLSSGILEVQAAPKSLPWNRLGRPFPGTPPPEGSDSPGEPQPLGGDLLMLLARFWWWWRRWGNAQRVLQDDSSLQRNPHSLLGASNLLEKGGWLFLLGVGVGGRGALS